VKFTAFEKILPVVFRATGPARPQISAVVPIYNEEEGIELLYRRLTAVFAADFLSHELVFVNDGSVDGSLAALRELAARDSRVTLVNLSRNFGKEVALTAGVDCAEGEFVVPLDADLQDPPEIVRAMMQKSLEGFDVVYGVRRSRQGESALKKITASMFYKTMSRLSSVPIRENTGDFRLMTREVVLALRAMGEFKRFNKGIFVWVGFRQIGREYDRDSRQFGTTKWNYWKLWNFAIEGITSFSDSPLKIATYVGLATSVLAFMFGGFYALKTLLFGDEARGFTTTIVSVFFLGGMQMFFLGMIGEYVGRTYGETKRRPLYIAKKFRQNGNRLDQTMIIRTSEA
jgi:glycosyltransferase involved in cell wall biosynthesis